MPKDILLDENLDLVIDEVAHDVAFGECTQQELVLIMVTEPGEWKHDPLLGLGLRKRTKSLGTREQIADDILDQAEYGRVIISSVELDKVINVFI